MQQIYNNVKSFLSNPENVDVLFDSGSIIWIDWREDDEDIINYFNEKLDNKIVIENVDNAKPYGYDILLKQDTSELQIPYEEEMDRDTTIKYLNDFIKPQYEIRWCLETLGSDTLGFVVLDSKLWDKLEQEFGKSTLNNYFYPVEFEKKMFDLDMDEVFSILDLREKNKNVDFSIIYDWVNIDTKEADLKSQRDEGAIDMKGYLEGVKLIKKIKEDFLDKYKELVF